MTLLALSSPTFELVVKPALISLVFLLIGGLIFAALVRRLRRERPAFGRERVAGVVIAGLSCLAMAGVIGFQAAFFAITG